MSATLPHDGDTTAPTTVTVHLSVHAAPHTITLAAALTVAGALLAGGFGGCRAARLTPAHALAHLD